MDNTSSRHVMRGIGIAALASTMWGISGTVLQLISQNLAIPATWMLSVRTLVTGVILLVISAFMYGKRIFNVFQTRATTISVVTYAIFGLIAACFVLLTLPTGLLFTYLSRRLVVQR